MASDANWKFVIEGTAVPQQREKWNKFNCYLECFFYQIKHNHWQTISIFITFTLANNINIYHYQLC